MEGASAGALDARRDGDCVESSDGEGGVEGVERCDWGVLSQPVKRDAGVLQRSEPGTREQQRLRGHHLQEEEKERELERIGCR